jgi:hypothetical protein
MTDHRISTFDGVRSRRFRELASAMCVIRRGLMLILPAILMVGSAGAQTPATSAAEKIYVADRDNSRIVRIDDMTGAGWTTFGTAGSGVTLRLRFLRNRRTEQTMGVWEGNYSRTPTETVA